MQFVVSKLILLFFTCVVQYSYNTQDEKRIASFGFWFLLQNETINELALRFVSSDFCSTDHDEKYQHASPRFGDIRLLRSGSAKRAGWLL